MKNIINKQLFFRFKIISSSTVSCNFTGNIEDIDQDKYWFLNGEYHRTDGPAVELSDGVKAWYLNGKRHRIDGPAVEYTNEDKEWWVNGKRHRTDGPAVEFPNGTKYWYLNGFQYSKENWENLILIKQTHSIS